MLSSLILDRSFFFNDTPPTEIYTLSLHDALPISSPEDVNYLLRSANACFPQARLAPTDVVATWAGLRSEEHTSELQSRGHLVCRLLLEKKKEEKTVEINAATLGPQQTDANSVRLQ